ncbi:MAG: hypothetical protein COA87_009280 [Halomonas sp.]|nr:hypothetical protein [Halomonas sp.]MBL1267923.1 hypothetical protein [Halomonas sp.]
MNDKMIFDASRGTVVWGVNWFRRDALSSFLDDLLEKERAGYPQAICDKVYDELEKIANQAAGLPDYSWWRKSILSELEGFLDIYREWNNHEGPEPEKVEGRKKELRNLRRKRNKLATRIRKNQYIIQEELDLRVIDSMYESLSRLVKSFPDVFKSLAKALERYIRRK